MRPLRIAGIIAALVVALLAIGIAVLHALFDGEKIKGELTRIMLEQKQRKLDIAGPLELAVWPDVGIKVGRLSLSEPGGKQEFLALDSARLTVAVMPLLSKQVQVRRVEIDGLKATLVKKTDGTLNIADLLNGGAEKKPEVGAGETPSTPLQIDVAGIKVANAQFVWHDEKTRSTTSLSNLDLSTGRIQADGVRQTLAVDRLSFATRGKSGNDAVELKLDAPKLLISPHQAGGASLNLVANLAGSGRTVAAKLALSAIEGNAAALKIGKLILEVDAKADQTTLKARLDSPVSVKLAARTFALDKIAGDIELSHPKMPMKPLKLPLAGNLRADLAQQTAALELTTRFDESNIAAKVSVAKFSPLALGFDVDIDRLNLDKYLPPSRADDQAAKQDKRDKLDFSALKGLDARGAIRIGSLQASKLKLARLNAKLAVADGRLDIAPLTLDLYQGTANGSLSLNADSHSIAVKQKLSGISINPLMKDLADKDLLEGRGNLVLDVTSRGDSVAAMKKALAGTASVNLRDGAIKGINLAQTLRDLKGKLGAKQDTTQQAKAGDKTDFSELSASLKIADGIARNDDLVVKSPFLRLAGAGDIDIGAGQMNYLAKASVVASSSGQGGKELEQLKGLTVPVRVSGPFDKLSYKIEFGSLVSDVAKAKVEEKKAEVKAKIEDKVKEKLKGLFGK